MASKTTTAVVPVAADIAPQSIAAAASATSGWVDAGSAASFMTHANLGVLGSGTVTLSFEQAKDDQGDGAKPLTDWTGGESAVNGANIAVDNSPEKLDHENGFTHFRAKLANVGGSGALVSALVLAGDKRYVD